ncbi:SpoIIE family protein phosphatase [Algivirga pacifica]|uniref:PPM-type phosphatase domain-containing protein n=1 Tax=Algivirga pacifica TaxID=1162670 RepID=A0ABP9D707_9BACT
MLLTKRWLLSILFSCFLLINGFSQQLFLKDYPFSRKLKGTYPKTVFQGENGMLWIGTNKGLFRFDGTTYQRYGADSLQVTAIAESTEGVLWVGLQDGRLLSMQNGELVFFEPEEGNAVEAVSDILFDPQGRMWFSTLGDGVYYYEEQRLYRLDEVDDMPDIYVYDLMLDKGGSVWAGTDGGIAVINKNAKGVSIEVIDSSIGLPDDIVKNMIPAMAQEGYWIGTEDMGVYHFNPTEKTFTPIVDEWNYGAVEKLVVSASELWVLTRNKGVVKWDCQEKSVLYYTKAQGLSTHDLSTLFADREGNIWMGSKKVGLERLPANRLLFYEPLRTQTQVVALGIYQEALWFVDKGKLYHYEGNEIIPVSLLPEQVTAISMYGDTQGGVWIGTYGEGVFHLSKEGILKQYKTELPDPNVINIEGDDKGNIWLATLRGGCHISRDQKGAYTFKTVAAAEGLDADYIYQVFVDSKENVWFATDGHGVMMMEQGLFHPLPELKALENKVIYGLAEDGKHRIWINVKGEGLYCYEKGKLVKHFGMEDGLRDNEVKVLKADKDGNIIAFHDMGLDIYEVEQERFVYLGPEDGLRDQMPFLNAVTKSHAGDLFFGTDKGIIRYEELHSQRDQLPKLLIDEVKLFGKEPLFGESLDLGYDQNYLTISFEGLWYSAPSSLRMRYRMKGYDRDWINTSSHIVTYSNLPSGDYVFEVETSLDATFEQVVYQSLPISVGKPFWEQAWFILLVISVLGFSGYWAVKQREQKLKEDKLLLEEKVRERTEEILIKNEELRTAFEDIETKNSKITKSINYAQRIQQALLPLEKNLLQVFPHHFIYYQPRDIVSGDFYWVGRQGEKVFFAAVDCTGHGVPGAFMSMIGASVLNEAIKKPGITPKQLLLLLDKAVISYLKQEEKNRSQNTSMDGMDVCLISWEPSTNQLVYAGAKRPLYMLQNKQLIEIKGDRRAIGGHGNFIHRKSSSFTEYTMSIEEPTALYLSSDGYADQFGGLENKKYTTKRLKQFLVRMADYTPRDQRILFEEEIQRWRGGIKQTDDILFAGIFLHYDKQDNPDEQTRNQQITEDASVIENE